VIGGGFLSDQSNFEFLAGKNLCRVVQFQQDLFSSRDSFAARNLPPSQTFAVAAFAPARRLLISTFPSAPQFPPSAF